MQGNDTAQSKHCFVEACQNEGIVIFGMSATLHLMEIQKLHLNVVEECT